MKLSKLILLAVLTLSIISCSKKDSDEQTTSLSPDTPNDIKSSEYVLRTGDFNDLYIYFGEKNMSSTYVSSLLSQDECLTNKISYTYTKPNGTITIGPITGTSTCTSDDSPFEANKTYPFSINGKKLTFVIGSKSYVLTNED